jgi:hypothetical protein
METTIIDMSGIYSLGRKGSDKPFKRQEYISQIEAWWKKEVAAPTDGCQDGKCGHDSDCAVHGKDTDKGIVHGPCDCGHEPSDSVGTEQRAQEQAGWQSGKPPKDGRYMCAWGGSGGLFCADYKDGEWWAGINRTIPFKTQYQKWDWRELTAEERAKYPLRTPKAWQPSPGERIQVRRTKGSSTSDWLEGEFVRTFEMHIQGLPAFRAAECKLIGGAITNWFDEFRPLSTWITHDGGPCPVAPDVRVAAKFDDGVVEENDAGNYT